ncbi:MAG: phosphoribosyltransferase family protein [Cyclobacteriaceae bacterium]|nr:phosphoribosyltransferase family protein [Cyclobacteriaceae bacterium]MCX7637539.1 phosphoribosyltransferase family protein [Cyclobacteriaceae bacterium]MDW8331339.1 phosphoribosyltransferase family protein [Cyclobacteriaceae bacterium]
MTADKTRILDSGQVKQKIRRIAYQIFEENFKEKSIVIAGIDGQGYTLAKLIAKEFEAVSAIPVTVVKVMLDKAAPQQHEVKLDCHIQEVKKKSIVLVDDVLNTGRTLAYAMKPFLETEVKKLEVAVLVNRSHTTFPIYPRYSGFELATTINDHVQVVLGKDPAVYLT